MSDREKAADRDSTEEQEIQAFQLVSELAAMTKDGEVDDDGYTFKATDQDCYETLHTLIDWARSIYWAEEKEGV